MKHKEQMNLYRVLSVIAIILVTFCITVVLCAKNHLYTDEWLCLAFIDVIFILIYIFEMEYERRRGYLASNPQSNFIRIAILYAFCAVITYAMTFLPEFSRPVMLIAILMCAVSNTTMAVTVGLFLDILTALASGGSFYALVCFVILTMLGTVLSRSLKEKKYRIWIALLMAFINLMVPGILYYLSYKEITHTIFIYGAVDGLVTALAAYFLFGWLWDESENEVENRLFDIVSEDYSEVKALKDFSMVEYRHANRVGDIAYRCAKQVGYDPALCLAGGFYYRMGRWLGEPYVKRAVDHAYALCFPQKLIAILAEYYGEEHLPSSPESALVHMIDALVIKLDALEQDVGKSQWNHDILIYQTLNEFSSTGMYDKSGMSMNQFLKVREFLAKEEL